MAAARSAAGGTLPARRKPSAKVNTLPAVRVPSAGDMAEVMWPAGLPSAEVGNDSAEEAADVPPEVVAVDTLAEAEAVVEDTLVAMAVEAEAMATAVKVSRVDAAF